MSKTKARRVNYRINYCSSEDPEYPVSQLVLQSAESKGWQTKRFASFPQTLIIQLLQLTSVTNLSFLSHQSKISTKIEIEGKQDHDQNWTRYGYTTLQSGLNTNYQSRELRNISLGGRLLLLLKFTIHQNYANTINIFNQIGIIALLVYGQKATVQRQMLRNKQGDVLANLSDLDRQTIMKLKTLQQMKQEAADNHRFDEAKQLKDDIQKLQANIKALIVLEKQKKEAIKREDYDEAKEIVNRMKRLRGPIVLPPRNIQSSNNMEHKAYELTPKKRSFNSSMENYNDPEIDKHENDHYRVSSRQSQPRGNKSFDLNSPVGPKINNSMIIPFDEIRVKGRERYPVEEILNNKSEDLIRKKGLPPKQTHAFRKNASIDEQQKQELQTPASPFKKGYLPSMKKLQKLTAQQFEECSKYFPVFNQITFQYLLSKQHSHRQKGISIINDLLSKADNENNKFSDQFVSASIFVIKKLIDDKIVPVLVLLIDYFGMMMKKYRPGPIGSASKNIQYVLQRLSDYLGHNNQKFKQQCEDVFASLPAHGLTNKQICYQILCGPIKDKYPKITIGRLNMIARIVGKFHLDTSADMVIDFAVKFLEDKNSEIRSAAAEVMAKVSRDVGYQNLYPEIQRLKPHIIKLIEDKIEALGGKIEKVVIGLPGQKSVRIEQKQPNNPEYYCDYCKLFDKRFEDDNFRDKHLFSSCPMITMCIACNQAIQVSALNNHLLAECQQHKYYKKCPKCKEAVPTKQYNTHTKIKECLSAKAPALANRCPLCHQDIQTGDQGWIKHLAKQGCPNQPRH